MRKLLVLLCLLGLVAVVSAQTTYGPANVVVTLNIPIWSSVSWQDMTIDFGPAGQAGQIPPVLGANGPGYDRWAWVLQGVAYSGVPDPAGTVFADDPWAGDPNNPPLYPASATYWESGDQADIYVVSNGGMTLSITPSGDLNNGAGNTLPTWFTAAGSWWQGGGFIADGTFYGGGWPLGGVMGWNPGQFLSDAAGTNFGFNFVPLAGNVLPTQVAFAMAGSPTYSMVMTQYVRGTFTFHSRVLRSGMADAVGNYTANLAVTITAP